MPVSKSLRQALCGTFLAAAALSGAAKDLGMQGTMHEIWEVDFRAMLFQKMAGIDWNEVNEEAKRKTREYLNRPSLDLPPASQTRVVTVDLTHTVTHDIKAPMQDEDGNWKWDILWPAGTTVNPSEFPGFTPSILIFNPESDAQVQLAKELIAYDPYGVFLMADGGNIAETSKKMGRPVFDLNPLLIQKIELTNVPAFVHMNARPHAEVLYLAQPFQLREITSIWTPIVPGVTR